MTRAAVLILERFCLSGLSEDGCRIMLESPC